MAGELSFHTTLEVVVVVVVEGEGEVVAGLAVLIWSAMSVVSLVILLVNVVFVVVLEGVVAAAPLDIAEVLVMAGGNVISFFPV